MRPESGARRLSLDILAYHSIIPRQSCATFPPSSHSPANYGGQGRARRLIIRNPGFETPGVVLLPFGAETKASAPRYVRAHAQPPEGTLQESFPPTFDIQTTGLDGSI